jgi:hypothetical protein
VAWGPEGCGESEVVGESDLSVLPDAAPGALPAVLVSSSPAGEDEMNTYLNAAVATERQQQQIADAAAYRRSRTVKAVRRRPRSRRVSAFLKDLAAASL